MLLKSKISICGLLVICGMWGSIREVQSHGEQKSTRASRDPSDVSGKNLSGSTDIPRIISVEVEGKPHLFRVSEQEIMYQPGIRVKRARHQVYIFSRMAFEKHVGKPGYFGKKTIQCRVTRQRQDSHVLPIGRIDTTYFHCDLLRKKAQHARRAAGLTWHFELPRQQREVVALGSSVRGKRLKIVLQNPGEWKQERQQWRYEIVPRFVKRANYATLFLPHLNVLQYVGTKPWQTLALVVQIHDYKIRTYQPKDPYVSAPLGGFRFHELYGQIVSAQRGR